MYTKEGDAYQIKQRRIMEITQHFEKHNTPLGAPAIIEYVIKHYGVGERTAKEYLFVVKDRLASKGIPVGPGTVVLG